MNIYQEVQRLIYSQFIHEPTSGQQNACKHLISFLFDENPLSAFILKGYAGTGKTTLVSALIQILPQLRLRTILLAPTGRAAKVLSNYSEKKAYTIHKKIYFTATNPQGITRCVRTQNLHTYTLFIVDEGSMIGNNPSSESSIIGMRSLLDDLIDYVIEGKHCRLLLIGDSAQLPPIGSDSSPALDANFLSSISHLNIYQYELTEVVRQAETSGILYNSTLIRNKICNEDMSFPLFHLNSFSDITHITGDQLEECLFKEYNNNREEDVVVICRTNKRANIFNQEIRRRILYRDGELNTGDLLMVVKNNYYWLENDSEIGFIANGDIVEILRVRKYYELYGFRFVDVTLRFTDYPNAPELDCKILLDTLMSESPALKTEEANRLFEEVLLDYEDIPYRKERIKSVKSNPFFNALQVKFAYSLTCHKTQGGQWNTIFVDQGFLPDNTLNLEYLRWLYTALTRATQKVYLLNFNTSFFEKNK